MQITIALIGLVGVLGAALFTNWDKIATSVSRQPSPQQGTAKSVKPPVSSNEDFPVAPESPGHTLQATAGDITYAIVSGRRQPVSASEYLLVLDVRISCRETAVNFWEDLFRLEVDGTKYSPQGGLSNKWVEPHSERKEQVKFSVPANSKTLALYVGKADSDRTSKIPIAPDVLAKWN